MQSQDIYPTLVSHACDLVNALSEFLNLDERYAKISNYTSNANTIVNRGQEVAVLDRSLEEPFIGDMEAKEKIKKKAVVERMKITRNLEGKCNEFLYLPGFIFAY